MNCHCKSLFENKNLYLVCIWFLIGTKNVCKDIQARLKSLSSQAYFCPGERAFSFYDVKSKRALPIMTQKVKENKKNKSAFPLFKIPMMRDIWYINTRRAKWGSKTAAFLPVCYQFAARFSFHDAAIFYWNRLNCYSVCIKKFLFIYVC